MLTNDIVSFEQLDPDHYVHDHNYISTARDKNIQVFVCVEVLRPSQPNGIMSSTVSLPRHTFTGQLSPLSG